MIRIFRPDCPHPRALENGNYKHPRNKEALKNAGSDKCMYCECKISHVDHGQVEHIKPKAADKFPELEFEWTNLGYVCAKCNVAKSDKFSDETPFIDPYAEDPEDFLFAAGSFLWPKHGNERGEMTITEIDLNRLGLLEKRDQKIKELYTSLKACGRTNSDTLRTQAIEELKKEGLPDKELSLIAKSFLKSARVL